jgi:hypothetical protein
MVATFDIPGLSMQSVPRAFPLPTNDDILPQTEQQNLKASLSELGYSSAYMSNNLGSVYVFAFFTAILLLLSGLLELFSRFPLFAKVNDKIKKKLHWNFVIRLVMEAAMEIAFGTYINLTYGKFDFKYFGAWFNYISTCVLGGALLALPIFIVIFYSRNFHKLEDEEFESKFGAVYEGLSKTSKVVLFYPVFFIFKRISFALASLLLFRMVLMQLILMTLITIVACVYVLQYQPFEEPFLNRMEVLNECFTLMLIYFTFCFTPLVQSVRDQYMIGFLFIGGMVLCIGTHLVFIVKDLINSLILAIKRYRYKKQNPHLFKKEESLAS